MTKVHIFTFILLSFWVSRGVPNPQSASAILKNALSWMTFRRNGVIASDTDLKSLFLDGLKKKYATYDDYRAYVIAFDLGVVPRLTLNENEACDPSYTAEYKNPYSNQVDTHHQMVFTFRAFQDRKTGGLIQFCDYRQGLVCKPTSKQCECPQGSSMQPISPGSPVTRCLLQQDEICAHIDLDHGTDPSHTLLERHLNYLIFNLEKPIGCQDGTQCRFKDTSKNLPKCYSNNAAPWSTPSDPGRREECALGLLATPGSCKKDDGSIPDKWIYKDYTCYNFGPPKSLTPGDPGFENKVGFCFDKFGQYSITHRNLEPFLDYDFYMRPYFIAAVHPRTVPLRGDDLQKYYDRYLEDVAPHFVRFTRSNVNNVIEAEYDERCNSAKTQKMLELWNYFTSLEAPPPPGQDYVASATPAELNAKMDELIDIMTIRPGGKICKVYRTPDDIRKPNYVNYGLPLECISTGPVDPFGNDGNCRVTSVNEQESRKFIDKILGFRDYLYKKEKEVVYPYDLNQVFDEYLESFCSTAIGPSIGRLHNPEPLPDRSCPKDYVCYPDFSDEHDLYDDQCNLEYSSLQVPACHQISDKTFGKCEAQQLSKVVRETVENSGNLGSAQRGDKCDYELEKAVRAKDFDKVGKLNPYVFLNWFSSVGVCDKWNNLECRKNNKCTCIHGKKCKGDKSLAVGVTPTWNGGGITGILILWAVFLY